MPNAFEEIAALAISEWNAKSVRRGSPATGVFMQLIAEHREATALIVRFKDTAAVELRRVVWEQLRSALLTHERAEAQAVYSAFSDYPNLQVFADEHERQAHTLDGMLMDLDKLPLEGVEWQAAFERLEAALRQHVAAEESVYFPRAEHVMGTDRVTALEASYLSAKQTLVALSNANR